jgi:uncharacterized protein YyaL (SSP411 family)
MTPDSPSPPFSNRLAGETSPYLLQHAHNPVDWYPWGEEAFEKARAEDKPIFLSIGYSSCHWCHVMEHESFEKEDVAAVLNRHFVSIKADREERPDLDEIYMTAVQLLTQRGGWPMSAWLLPDGRPFHGGTYYPPQQFIPLLENIAEVYRTRRVEVVQNAERLTAYMAELNSGEEPPSGPFNRQVVENALSRMGAAFDETYGGFRGAPKFPPSAGLPLLLHEYERSRQADPIRWAVKTLDAMALGGIRDHLGGGFHRYSTDRRWLLPHFEKMLYDNAQLSRIYADAYRITGRAEYRNVAVGMYDWVLREMTGPEGGFYSTLDADSEGEEGKFYVWSYDEILQALGKEDGELFARIYNIDPRGNYADEATRRPTGLNIPHLSRPLADYAKEFSEPPESFEARIATMRQRLLDVRSKRVWPGLDDKILASWNGLMIGGFAHGGKVLNRPDYLSAAVRAATFALDRLRRDGRLLRSYRNGETKGAAFLEDYSFLAHALLDVYDATGEARWLEEAKTLADQMVRYFWDEKRGGFYNTASDHEAILMRTKTGFDQAIPSGNSMAALSLLRLAKTTGDDEYLSRARRLLNAFLGIMQRNPMGTETMILAAAQYLEQAAAAGIPEEEAVPLGPTAEKDPIKLRAELTSPSTPPGGRSDLKITAEIAPGWHINSHDPEQDYLTPTEIRLSSPESVTYSNGMAPEPERVRLGFNEETLSVYQDEVVWEIPLQASAEAQPGRVPVRVYFDYQPCNDESCLSPESLVLEVGLEILEKE